MPHRPGLEVMARHQVATTIRLLQQVIPLQVPPIPIHLHRMVLRLHPTARLLRMVLQATEPLHTALLLMAHHHMILLHTVRPHMVRPSQRRHLFKEHQR